MDTDTSPLALDARRILAWRRVRFALLASLPFGLLMSIGSVTPWFVWAVRACIEGLLALVVFGIAEQRPERLPAWFARWALQVLGVVVSIPFGAFLAYWITTGGEYFWRNEMRVTGFFSLLMSGLLFAPWIALGAMVRQREALAAHQATRFRLERSELERQALDARLRLMQAQVQPHFLFNTLANVRALVRSGSPQAGVVLDSLIAYLRAAVPQLDEPMSTLGRELQLVRAYLELMHMRMPDRLQYALHADDEDAALQCPPMSLLTLVENAVRHGIDPGEDGGRIEVVVSVREGRCIARVVDTGVGMQSGSAGLGTGLANLRERLKLAFGGDAQLRIAGLVPHGVSAEIEFPARRSPA